MSAQEEARTPARAAAAARSPFAASASRSQGRKKVARVATPQENRPHPNAAGPSAPPPAAAPPPPPPPAAAPTASEEAAAFAASLGLPAGAPILDHYSLTLVVDANEKISQHQRADALCGRLERLGHAVASRRLPVGDFLWVLAPRARGWHLEPPREQRDARGLARRLARARLGGGAEAGGRLPQHDTVAPPLPLAEGAARPLRPRPPRLPRRGRGRAVAPRRGAAEDVGGTREDRRRRPPDRPHRPRHGGDPPLPDHQLAAAHRRRRRPLRRRAPPGARGAHLGRVLRRRLAARARRARLRADAPQRPRPLRREGGARPRALPDAAADRPRRSTRTGRRARRRARGGGSSPRCSSPAAASAS